jgi:hypothetical protein
MQYKLDYNLQNLEERHESNTVNHVCRAIVDQPKAILQILGSQPYVRPQDHHCW